MSLVATKVILGFYCLTVYDKRNPSLCCALILYVSSSLPLWPKVIACHYASPEGLEALKPYVPQIWPVLYGHFESAEEGTRNVVAECVGKLTLLDPDTLLPKLKVRGSRGSI